ncbi:MAG TPA: hypothetical protein VNT30_13345 [Stellaceae bacterium]|nr:hypothetical protein [Stellaceae bacterium]
MGDLFGTSLGGFLGLTVVMFGGASFMTGQALADTWRPYRQMLLYSLLLGAGDRFLVWGLAHGELLSLPGYILDTLVIVFTGSLAYRVTQARKMVVQYPWLYERAGLFQWREKT